jgi:hypothetical protein
MAKIKRRRCSKCRGVGHNSATCKKRAKKKATKKKATKKKATKKKAKKKTTKKKTKKKATRKKKTIKKSKTTRRGSSTTRSRQGRSCVGACGWIVLYHGGRTGKTQHDKTWAVKVEKSGSRYRVLTRHGRRTGQKNVTTHPWTTMTKAVSKANSLLRSKAKKGYGYAGSNRKKRLRKKRLRRKRARR